MGATEDVVDDEGEAERGVEEWEKGEGARTVEEDAVAEIDEEIIAFKLAAA